MEKIGHQKHVLEGCTLIFSCIYTYYCFLDIRMFTQRQRTKRSCIGSTQPEAIVNRGSFKFILSSILLRVMQK